MAKQVDISSLSYKLILYLRTINSKEKLMSLWLQGTWPCVLQPKKMTSANWGSVSLLEKLQMSTKWTWSQIFHITKQRVYFFGKIKDWIIKPENRFFYFFTQQVNSEITGIIAHQRNQRILAQSAFISSLIHFLI